MNKYTEMLEKHVQWIALAIGGVWLLFMVWTYVLQAESSSVEVGGQKLSASEVDTYVRDTKAYPLRERIERQDKLPDKVEDYAAAVRSQLQLSPDGTPKLDGVWVRASGGTDAASTGVTPPPPPVARVKELPKVPKATQIATVNGRSVVELPAPVGAAPDQPAGAQVVSRMISWVSVFGNIPMKDLAKEFERTVGPQVPQLHLTTLLKVELLREELLPNGQWTKAQVIQSWDFGGQNTQQLPPWPPANDKAAQMQFAQALSTQQKTIAQPGFFTPKRGDIWHKPGELGGQVGGPNVNPGGVPPQDPPPDMAEPPPPRVPGGVKPGTPPRVLPPPRPTNPGGGRNRERTDATRQGPARVMQVAQVFDEPGPMPSAPTPTFPGMPGYPGQPGQPGQPGVAPGAATAAPLANPPGMAPAGPFDPANASDIQVWVHDVTVEPGKTYRYRLRYGIKNPVFGANAAAEPAKLGDVFLLESEPSDQTPSVTIPNTVIFFAVSVPMVGDQPRNVNFEVFTWTVHGLTKQVVAAQPGDLVDPTLKLTLVDIRDKGSTIILMDEHGALTSRNVHVDAKAKELDDARLEAQKTVVPPLATR